MSMFRMQCRLIPLPSIRLPRVWNARRLPANRRFEELARMLFDVLVQSLAPFHPRVVRMGGPRAGSSGQLVR